MCKTCEECEHNSDFDGIDLLDKWFVIQAAMTAKRAEFGMGKTATITRKAAAATKSRKNSAFMSISTQRSTIKRTHWAKKKLLSSNIIYFEQSNSIGRMADAIVSMLL